MTEFPTRDQVERRLHALVADWLDTIARDNQDGFDIGIVGFIGEVSMPDPETTLLRREEGGYTPPLDTDQYTSYYCSDHRWWMKRALFGDAGDYFRFPPSEDEENGDEE